VIDHDRIAIARWTGPSGPTDRGLNDLLSAYHLQTEAEKGESVSSAKELPERYRAEILDPATAFADCVVLVALSAHAAVGCLVMTAPADGRCELKRLWTDPAFRGHGIARRLIDAALARALEHGVSVVQLSVWQWRVGALALYERLGFSITESWDERDQLVCLQRSVAVS
jgi:putative acetyltransferase